MTSLVDERIARLDTDIEAQALVTQKGAKGGVSRRRRRKPHSPAALKRQLFELSESAAYDWIATSRLTIEVYRSALQMLFDDAAQLERAIVYWRSIASSSFAAGRLFIQTSPSRLTRVATTLAQRLRAQTSQARSIASLRAALPPSLLVTSLFPHLRAHQRHIEQSSDRSLSFVTFSPLRLTRQEAALHVEALQTALRDIEMRIGLLIGQAPAADSPAAHMGLDSDRFNAKFGQLSTAIYSALQAKAMPGENVDLAHTTEMRAVLSQIANDLETNRNRVDGILLAHGPPSRLLRIWPVALLGPPVAWLIGSRLWRSRATFRKWLDLAKETVRGFVVDWVLEPCLKILETVRHGSDTLITSKESLQSDLASLERMVADFSRDQKTYSEQEIQEIAQRVKAGDMTPVLRVWEADIRTPVRSAVAGSLIRTLLIQVQKVKVDVALAMDGIEKMLRSQQLTFAFVGVAPSLLVVYALNGVFSSLLPTSNPTSSKVARRQAWSTTRAIDRLVQQDADFAISSVEGQVNLGRLLVLTSRLRSYAESSRHLSRDAALRDEFLADVRLIEDGPNRAAALARLWRSWAHREGWKTL